MKITTLTTKSRREWSSLNDESERVDLFSAVYGSLLSPTRNGGPTQQTAQFFEERSVLVKVTDKRRHLRRWLL